MYLLDFIFYLLKGGFYNKIKTALLIPFNQFDSNNKPIRKGYVWMTPSEKIISPDFKTKKEALNNRPDQSIYVCRDDGYNKI